MKELTNNRTIPYYYWWRDKVLKRDKYTCQDCKESDGFLDVHHINSFAKDVNGRFDPDNGVTLCLFCHGRRHGHPEGFMRGKEDTIIEVPLDDTQLQIVYSKWVEKAMKKRSTKPVKVI